jgi:putative transposase
MPGPGPFRWTKTSPEIIRVAAMLHVRFPLSLRNVEGPLHEQGTEISRKTGRFWRNHVGPICATEIRKCRIEGMRSRHWQRQLAQVFEKTNRNPRRRARREARPQRDLTRGRDQGDRDRFACV